MLESGDPIAEALNTAYPSIRMPNLSLGEVDVDDLMAFFKASDLQADNQVLKVDANTQEN